MSSNVCVSSVIAGTLMDCESRKRIPPLSPNTLILMRVGRWCTVAEEVCVCCEQLTVMMWEAQCVALLNVTVFRTITLANVFSFCRVELHNVDLRHWGKLRIMSPSYSTA